MKDDIMTESSVRVDVVVLANGIKGMQKVDVFSRSVGDACRKAIWLAGLVLPPEERITRTEEALRFLGVIGITPRIKKKKKGGSMKEKEDRDSCEWEDCNFMAEFLIIPKIQVGFEDFMVCEKHKVKFSVKEYFIYSLWEEHG